MAIDAFNAVKRQKSRGGVAIWPPMAFWAKDGGFKLVSFTEFLYEITNDISRNFNVNWKCRKEIRIP